MTHAWAISVSPQSDEVGDTYWHAEIAEAFGVTYVRDYYVTDWSAAQVAADMLAVVTAAEKVWTS